MKIAVFVDREGNARSFYEPGVIQLFSCENGSWSCIREFSGEVNEEKGLAEIQRGIQTMLSQLEDCRVLIMKFVKGVPLSILKEMGCSLWTVEGSPLLCFDEVREKEEKITVGQLTIKPALPEPLPVGDIKNGIYTIDLVNIQAKGAGFNSKEVLLLFLETQRFRELEVICAHVPKWFEKELGLLKLKFRIEESNDDLSHAIIYPIV